MYTFESNISQFRSDKLLVSKVKKVHERHFIVRQRTAEEGLNNSMVIRMEIGIVQGTTDRTKSANSQMNSHLIIFCSNNKR